DGGSGSGESVREQWSQQGDVAEAFNVDKWPSAKAVSLPMLVQKLHAVLGTEDDAVARVIGVRKEQGAYRYRVGGRRPGAEISGRFRAEYEALRLELLRLRQLGESFDAKEWVDGRVAQREPVKGSVIFSGGALRALKVDEWPSGVEASAPVLVQKLHAVLGTGVAVAAVTGSHRDLVTRYVRNGTGPTKTRGRYEAEYEPLRLELLRRLERGELFDAREWVRARSAARRVGAGSGAEPAVDDRLGQPGQPLSLPGGPVRLAEAAGDTQAFDVWLGEDSTLGQGRTGLDELLDSPAVLDTRVRPDHVEGLPWSPSAAATWALAPGTELPLGDTLDREDRASALLGHPELFPAEVQEILARLTGEEEGGSLPD
ncbi:hypothetical protein ABZZ20_35355, partial [Streptomyces sp. NPDC006430]|uniref:hypothetical protein n=1 Tax=Streptomyces sp. NPDC006430 TaxID=3154299 RepID=UPI0033AE139E